ncbi:MAG: type I 3-dehydroquinate dehydratase [archaeon]
MRFIVQIKGPDALKQIEAAKKAGAGLVEIHLDKVNDKKVFEESSLQTVAVMRPDWAGGEFKGYEGDRIKRLKEFSEVADFVEVEREIAPQYKSDVILHLEKGSTVSVVSIHYRMLPLENDIVDAIEDAKKMGIIVRVCAPVESHDDVLRVLKAVEKSKVGDEASTIVVDGYGKDEKLLRYLSYHFGSYWTRASPDEIKGIKSLKAGKLSKKLISDAARKISK